MFIVLLIGLIITISMPLAVTQTASNITINANGSITGTENIQQKGNTYMLTANISGTIQVQKSNIIINGSGFTLDGKGTGGINLNNPQLYPTLIISNVTIENLFILNGGVGSSGGGNYTFYNDYISGTGACIMLISASYNNISFCTLNSTSNEAVGMMEGSSHNTITENNLVGGINVFLSVNETVDRNYWGDYLAKYPSAVEVDHSGIGNTPYVYYSAQNGETVSYQDSHPLMKPVEIPLTRSTIAEFPYATLIVLVVIAATAFLLLYHRSMPRSKKI